MLNKDEIHKAMELAATLIEKIADIQKQHNMMLLDLYERVSKLEEGK